MLVVILFYILLHNYLLYYICLLFNYNYSFSLDLVCDLMVKLTQRDEERALRASDVLAAPLHIENQAKRKIRSPF